MRIRRRFFSSTIRTRCRLNLGETTLDRTSYIFQILAREMIVEMVFRRSRLLAFIESMNYQIPNVSACTYSSKVIRSYITLNLIGKSLIRWSFITSPRVNIRSGIIQNHQF
uniref:Uncharacterized protein n=1 Tax=Kalanchoe fedtschenkoi TaxID=63787 RepID=A0A7N1A739_KALFE